MASCFLIKGSIKRLLSVYPSVEHKAKIQKVVILSFWWAGRDSNPRRLSRLIYSQMRLTASLPTREKQRPSKGLRYGIVLGIIVN